MTDKMVLLKIENGFNEIYDNILLIYLKFILP